MRAWLIPTLLTLAGCAVYQLNDRYGAPDPTRYDRMALSYPAEEYAKVRTIVDQRCSVCHSCNDAPCQLNLASHEGLTRGANRERVYGTRLAATAPTRLFFDAQSASQWRAKGFHPVLNERAASPEAEREASVLYRLLALKAANPLPDVAVLRGFDFSLDRAEQCPAIEAIAEYEKKNPLWGMPYGMRGLSAAEQATLTKWIEAGAPRAPVAPLPPEYAKRVAQWESFLNGDSLKARLAGRYVYEHWFIGHFYFADLPGQEYFELVRSRTPPGQPIDVIATRRPYDDPGVERVYYRLRRLAETPLAKTHMPYALSDARLAHLKALFIDAPYEVSALPSYEPEVASNPFVAFRDLPVESRYRLMLEESQFTLMGFIKGPVCRGQVALDVINDHFWIMFEQPDPIRSELQAAFLARELANLRLPAEEEQGASGPLKWRHYAQLEAAYLEAKSAVLASARPPTLDLLWDGDGRNPNAALTVVRHFDSASVVQGLLGEQPQTVLLIGYPLLERIHYLLVAGFDIYGNVGHQLSTRLYMDFLRMEGEMNFLAFLPRAERQAVHNRWYRGADKEEIALLRDTQAYFPAETGIRFATSDPLAELDAMMKKRAAPVASTRYALPTGDRELHRLASLRGRALANLPEASILTVRDESGTDHHFSLIANRAHSNVAELFDEAERRLPDEDSLLLASGFIPAYPNAFFLVQSSELGQFVDAVAAGDYAALASAYGIRRTDLRFWPHSDALQAAWKRSEPREAGLFDYNRLENR
ncbi:MAG: fatty acid cis/trans isomerase [Betaproteobacteria bacterium]|nr:fatty acid cis/trans isomerase [Betaproteobacteria bacterium]MBV9360966.1 fatty acid cis/trans isomerase [Betaproteobacteria bacterium]